MPFQFRLVCCSEAAENHKRDGAPRPGDVETPCEHGHEAHKAARRQFAGRHDDEIL